MASARTLVNPHISEQIQAHPQEPAEHFVHVQNLSSASSKQIQICMDVCKFKIVLGDAVWPAYSLTQTLRLRAREEPAHSCNHNITYLQVFVPDRPDSSPR